MIDDGLPLPTKRETTAPKRFASKSVFQGRVIDTPGLYDDEPIEIPTLIELEEVKKERTILMRSIAQFKQASDIAGGEGQEQNIRQITKVHLVFLCDRLPYFRSLK